MIGGAVNGNGMIEISVTGTGENSYLSKVMEMVKQAQSEKSKLESISRPCSQVVILYCLIRRCVSIYRLVTRNERFVSSI